MQLATDFAGLRLVLATTIADRYDLQLLPTVRVGSRQRGAGRGFGLGTGMSSRPGPPVGAEAPAQDDDPR